jgi:peptide/nickel transport system substrate-binding protein
MTVSRTSRRVFLRSTIGIAGITLLAGCTVATPGAAPTSPPASAGAPAATAVPVAAAASAPTTAAAPAATVAPAATATTDTKLTVGMSITQPNMDPGSRVAGNGLAFILPMYEALTWVDAGGKVSPMLATSWQQPAPNTWRFTLRDGVTFHNGDPFDAESVKFTYDRALNADNKLPALARVANVGEVQIVDSKTVDIVTKSVDVIFPSTAAQVFIGSGKYFTSAGEQGYTSTPVGTGAWRMTQMNRDDTYAFTRFDGYWGAKPSIRDLTIKVIPDTAARVSALRAGDVDLIEGISVDDIDRINASGQTRVLSVPIGSVTNLLLNDSQPYFADQRVRQAVNYAVDKQKLATALRKGYTRPTADQIIGDDCFGFNPNLQPYAYDPDMAKQLLADAGFANGFETDAHMANNPIFGQTIGEAVSAELANVGITMNVTVPDNALWLDEFYARRPRPGMLAGGFNYDPQYDAKFVFSWFSTESGTPPFWGQVPDQFSQLWTQQNSESDPAKRQAMLQQMSQTIHDLAPAISLWQNVALYGANNRVQWQPGPGIIMDFRQATVS